jgi:diguanylate cyclase (GGDEF)-like protein/PAS domain S-box-containing protein
MAFRPQLSRRAWLVAVAYLAVGGIAIPGFEALLDLVPFDPVAGVGSRSVAGWIFIALTAPLVALLVDWLESRADDEAHLARQVIDHGDDGILLTSPDGRILSANPAMCRICGYSEQELVRGGRALLLDEDDPELQAMLAQRRATGHVTGQLWMRHADGHRVCVELSSTVFQHRGKDRSAMIVRDVTERDRSAYYLRMADAALKTQEVIVAELDADWRVLWANQGAETISGFSARKRVGMRSPFYEHMQRTDPLKLEEIVRTVNEDGIWTGDLETKRSDGTGYPVHGYFRRLEGPTPGEIRYVVVLADRSQLLDYQHRIERMQMLDPVTGLPNRRHFEQRLHEHLQAIAGLPIKVTVYLVELDHFVAVNESRGHRFGDLALCQAAARLQRLFGHDAVVVRHTGSGFFVYVPGGVARSRDADDPVSMEEKVVAAFRKPLDVAGERITLPVSVGSSVFPDDAEEVADLMRNAEVAVQVAKDREGDTAQAFATSMPARTQSFVALSKALREDLEQRQSIEAHFQPIVDARTLEPIGMEALARWYHASRGWISPAEFIPVAERCGLIDDLADLLLRQTCDQLHAAAAAGMSHLGISMNLSARQFRADDLADRILHVVEEKGIDPRRLTLEITESLLMQDPKAAQAVLRRLRTEGIRIVLDDFGMGYSSLGYLKNFEVDGLKIDRAFVANLPDERRDAAVLRAILSVARELDLSVVAEGVERQEQADHLRNAGCQWLQGFLFGSAIAGDALIERFAAGTSAAGEQSPGSQ